ncbi:MAG: xanthine dehydrogenase family protein molybdopterin-binding subunit [Burkholderiales bacterium]|nr:xanthine dehydrogenase family protein molybdopterin-binding subunit [Burkholderiales bacterium]
MTDKNRNNAAATAKAELPRRDFLVKSAALGGGLMLGMPLSGAAGAAEAATGADLTQWIAIHSDDTVVIRIARSELGQGSFTGLAQLVCEELECDWSKVRSEYADTNDHIRRNRIFGNMTTGGSRAIRDSQEYLRTAGAAAREMLVSAAATQWKVPASELTVERGVVTHAGTGRKARYGELVAAAAKLEVPKTPKLKNPADWKLIGTSPARFDIPEKTTGKQIFAADVRLPGLLHASIAQVPVFGGKLKSVGNVDAAKAMRGVKGVVEAEDWVAVVADNWWRANQALKVLTIEWDPAGNGDVSSESIKAFLRTGIDAKDPAIARKDGDAAQALAKAAKVIEAEYYAPFLNHATMEPQTATARLTDDKVEVWVGTQNGETSIAAASEASGVPLDKVYLYKMHAGGGFGRRGPFNEYVKQAIRIAQTLPAGTPVRLQWSREEDMQQGRYRPVSIVRLRAGLDDQGNWTAWEVRQSEQSVAAGVLTQFIKDGVDQIGVRVFSDSPYDVPNYTNEYVMRNTHVPPGPWRAVAHTNNPIARECFIDEICHAIGKDPVAFRRPLLAKKPKDLGVLDAVTKAAGWDKPLPKGVFRGVAVSDSYGSFSAAVVELSVRDGTVIDVKRVLVALDPGYVVHPDAVRAQIEGGAVWALSAAMHEEITIEKGRVVQTNFADYPILTLAQTPEVVPILVPSGGFWGGVGEPPFAAIPAALNNALFAATGKRVRSTPLKLHGFSYA